MPLLELSLSEMNLLQDMRYSESQCSQSPSLCFTPDTQEVEQISRETGPGGGRLQCKLTSDYYNRALSGWEPFIEPWRYIHTFIILNFKFLYENATIRLN